MNVPKFPTTSVVAAASALVIGALAAPVSASPGFFTGMAGSVCAATQGHFSKITVFNNGAIANKNTGAQAIINCAVPLEQARTANVYISWNKKDSQNLNCIVHRRSFDYLSGASNSQSSSAVGPGLFTYNSLTADYFNSVQCTIPRNNGSGQNAINGVLWFN